MRHVVLISCASQKRGKRSPARDLYKSALFKKSLGYVEAMGPDLILVLSAKHHVLPLDEEVEPYDQTLGRMRAEEVRVWSDEVVEQLYDLTDLERDRFTILAGKKYRKHLVPHLTNCEIPMEGLRIGEQLRFLNEAVGGE